MKVICKISNGYPNLTVGKEYEVKDLVPRLITHHFTFPRYTSVIDDDDGKTSTGHAYRFETLEGQSVEEYMKEHVKDIKDEN